MELYSQMIDLRENEMSVFGDINRHISFYQITILGKKEKCFWH